MARHESRRGFIKETGLMVGGVLGTSVIGGGAVAEAQRGGAAPAAATSMSKGAQLRAAVAKGEPLLIPHVNNVFIARLAEMEGFPAVRVGGSVIGSSVYGLPELFLGYPTVSEEIQFAANIAMNTDLPVIADGDDGGPTAAHVYRATQQFERAGIAAVAYEDASQEGLITKAKMVDKIKAAVDARKEQGGLMLLIRNDSMSEGETMEQSVERGVAYAAAGADMLWFSGMKTADLAKAQAAVGKPLLTSAAPTMTPAELKAVKLSMIFYHIERVGYGAVLQAMREWKTTGKATESMKMTIADADWNKALHTDVYRAMGRKYGLIK
jgi:2-methylisocitrate lyase-like PEP mutase family enzyme